MEKVAIGTRVRPLGIQRLNVADGARCRVVLLDEDPRMKYIAWDDERKKRVEVDQNLVIRYGLRPMTNFYYLVAKLNTDMNGNVVGDQFVIEYLQLSENLNNDLADAISENPNFTSFMLTKVAKKGPDGQDFSHIKVTPSSYKIDGRLLENLNKLRAETEAIETMWSMIDRATSMTAAEYIKLREGDDTAQIAAPAAAQPKQVAAPVDRAPMPSAPENFTETFASGDDFSDGF